MNILPKPKEFWIVNISNRDVSLSDLYLTVRSYKSVNLLDNKHYYYTWEQILKSVTEGSIYKKRNLIAVRNLPPKYKKPTKQTNTEDPIPSRSKSIYEIKEEKFEELEITDDQFAEEIANSIK